MFRTKLYKIILDAAVCSIALLLTSCDREYNVDMESGNDMVQVQPILSGSLISDGFGFGTRVSSLPESSQIIPLPEGTTLWLIAEKLNPEGNIETRSKTAYVVREVGEDTGITSLYPCDVDDEGNVVSVNSSPMFISEGNYRFWAISPARKLNEVNGMTVKNGDELLATDDRYAETAPTSVTVSGSWSDNQSRIEIIKLNPLFNQTAQLKFTITSEAKWIHSLELLASGVEYSGLQDETENNWSLTSHLQTDYGMKNGTFRETKCITGVNSDETHFLEVTTPVLPVNAIATPVVVEFEVLINGVPSPFSIMLTEKDFQAGYSYHYKGQIKLQHGVAIIVWQFVEWGTDVEFD